MTDFESAERLAFEKVFKNAKLSTCFFHYCQNLYKNISIKGLSTAYKKIDSFMGWVRDFMLMALLPMHLAQEHMKMVMDPEEMKKKYEEWRFNDVWQEKVRLWLEEYWFKTYGSPTATFKMRVWAVDDLDLRTNDVTESQNRVLFRKVGMAHPPFWKWVSKLREVAADSHLRLLQWEKHKRCGPRRLGERTKNWWLQRARDLLDLDAVDTVEYLKLCSQAMSGCWMSLERSESRRDPVIEFGEIEVERKAQQIEMERKEEEEMEHCGETNYREPTPEEGDCAEDEVHG